MVGSNLTGFVIFARTDVSFCLDFSLLFYCCGCICTRSYNGRLELLVGEIGISGAHGAVRRSVLQPALVASTRSFTVTLQLPNANISFEAIEQIASPQAAEETPRDIRGSISSRHGRCIFWIAGVHTNAIRSAKPEGHSGSDSFPCSMHILYNSFFF